MDRLLWEKSNIEINMTLSQIEPNVRARMYALKCRRRERLYAEHGEKIRTIQAELATVACLDHETILYYQARMNALKKDQARVRRLYDLML